MRVVGAGLVVDRVCPLTEDGLTVTPEAVPNCCDCFEERLISHLPLDCAGRLDIPALWAAASSVASRWEISISSAHEQTGAPAALELTASFSRASRNEAQRPPAGVGCGAATRRASPWGAGWCDALASPKPAPSKQPLGRPERAPRCQKRRPHRIHAGAWSMDGRPGIRRPLKPAGHVTAPPHGWAPLAAARPYLYSCYTTDPRSSPAG